MKDGSKTSGEKTTQKNLKAVEPRGNLEIKQERQTRLEREEEQRVKYLKRDRS